MSLIDCCDQPAPVTESLRNISVTSLTAPAVKQPRYKREDSTTKALKVRSDDPLTTRPQLLAASGELGATCEQSLGTCDPQSELHASQLAHLSEQELIRRSREHPAETARCLDLLFERVYPRIAHWCLRFYRDHDEAADLAQEVVLRAYTKLDSFRSESSFSTWLYTLTRRAAIDRGIRRRRDASRTAPVELAEGVEDASATSEAAELLQAADAVRNAMIADLDPLEARVIYLHHVDGFSLSAITQLLSLTNKSGAKAYLQHGMRKLRRRFQPSVENESEVS